MRIAIILLRTCRQKVWRFLQGLVTSASFFLAGCTSQDKQILALKLHIQKLQVQQAQQLRSDHYIAVAIVLIVGLLALVLGNMMGSRSNRDHSEGNKSREGSR